MNLSLEEVEILITENAHRCAMENCARLQRRLNTVSVECAEAHRAEAHLRAKIEDMREAFLRRVV